MEEESKPLPLPQKLIFMGSGDKSKHGCWNEGDDPLLLPRPFRCLLSGGVNSGKTTTILNILMRDPINKKIFLIHAGGKATKDYDMMGRKNIKFIDSDSIPNAEEFVDMIGDVPSSIIIEDLAFNGMKRVNRDNLDRIFGYVSTHSGDGWGTNVFITTQYFCNIPASIRDLCNVFIMYRMKNRDTLITTSRKLGIKKQDVIDLMDLLEGRQALWIDATANSPYPIRIDGYQLIELD